MVLPALPRNALAGISLASLLLACEPKLVVGTWTCSGPDRDAGGDGSVTTATNPIALPWSTGFENGFCDYTSGDGFCYADKRAGYETVTSPVHSGSFAAAFSLSTSAAFDGNQTRCVRQGTLPNAAYYSAYFFISAAPTETNNWNLMHFRGGNAPPFHGLWDVSLAIGTDGALRVFVFDFLRGAMRMTSGVPAVPIGSWFQLEVFLKRAADTTGEFAVYQDGQVALRITNLVTDDSVYGQWYLGNLANSLVPAENTLYVDDVAIRDTP
jgi:hypothetical protein